MADYGSYHQFVSRFVGPLVMGGHVEVSDLIGPGVLSGWQRPVDLDATLVAAINDTLRTRLTRLGPMGSVDVIPLDALALAAVWHNVLFMSHPDARTRTALRRKARQWCVSLLDWVGAPLTRGEVTLRHGLLHGLARLGRVDTHVTFWAGYADFVGVAPPPVLVAWPKLRRVREDRTRVSLIDLVSPLDDDTTDEGASLLGVVRAAFALSPLTDLSLPDRPAVIAFAWSPPGVNALADDALRGAVQRVLLARGTAALRAVEQATLALLREEDVSSEVAAMLLRFHLELVVMDALSSRPAAEPRPQGGAQAQGTSGGSPAAQPLAFDAYARLGYARAATLTGLSPELLRRALWIDPSRPLPKDPPSGPLMARAGALEART